MLLFALGLMTLATAAARIRVRGICHLHVYLKNSNEKIRSFVILTFAISSTTRRLIT